MKYEVLYHFSHGPVHVLETKRTDLPSSAGPEKIYQWFLVEEGNVHLLNFQSMTLAPQRRIFSEGMIELNLQNCRGRILGKDLELTRQDTMTESLQSLVSSALRKKQ